MQDRYVIKYVIRRLIRYAKYAAIGGVVAVLGGTMLGTLGSGLAFFAAPSLGVGMGIGVITAMAKASPTELKYGEGLTAVWLEA